MSTGLQFDHEMARRAEAVYKTRDAARRRRAILDALQLEPEERVIDIGTGPGFVAYEMADLVVSKGRILGVDTSEPMLELAKKRCADKPWVEFQSGNATNLPVPDASFDAALSVQVFEYIKDLTKALAEMHRALRPGGRAVVISTDWESIVWHSTLKERMDKVLSAFAEHCVFSDLPRTLGPKLIQVGFRLVDQRVVAQFNPICDVDSFSYGLMPIVKSFVPGRKGVTNEDAEAWAEELQRLGKDYFFCLNQFLFLVMKPN
jgi:arsenite methyltransferase